MMLLSLAMSAVLVAVALMHVLWALGRWWPIRDEAALVRTVVGFRGADRMPGPIPCALVAVGLLLAALWPWLPDGWLRRIGLIVIAVVFLIRGILPYRPFWRDMTPQEPFARLDRRRYGPLSLGLSLGHFALIFGAN